MGDASEHLKRMHEERAALIEHSRLANEEFTKAKRIAYQMAKSFLFMVDGCPEELAAKLEGEGLTRNEYLERAFGPHVLWEPLFAAIRLGMTLDEHLAADSPGAWIGEYHEKRRRMDSGAAD